MPQTPIPLDFLPGVQRDGTKLDSATSTDALWTRWRMGRPRSMGGFQQSTNRLSGIGRRVHMFYQGSQTIIHIGTSVGLQQIILDQNGNVVSIHDRTPVDFSAGPDVGWTLDATFDTTSNKIVLVAHAVSDLSLLSDTNRTICWLGNIQAQSPLTDFTNPSDQTGGTYAQPLVSGGIVCVQPYTFDFDSNGAIGWSAPNLPNYLGVTGGSSGAGQARVSAQKVVAGMPLRGGGVNSPAGLFWTLSEVISASFIGSPAVFSFNTVSPSSSILSANGVIEYDGLYFWAGVDRFLVYNGTVVEIPNRYNQDFFFNNINWQFAAKSFAFKIPRYGEIWWCAPLFGASEPNWAIIFNVRENCWYDTPLPDGGRGAGYFAQGFRFPVMTDVVSDGTGYGLWLHEMGTDRVNLAGVPTPVRKYYQTPYLGGLRNNPPTNQGVSMQQFEPDMVRSGDMLITPTGAWNAQSGDSPGTPVPLPANPSVPQEQLVGFKFERRLPALIVESNTLGGEFITGKNFLQGDYSKDSRLTGGAAASPGGGT